MNKYWKLIAQVLVTVLLALYAAMTDGVTTVEALTIAVALVQSVIVYVVPNVPQFPRAKEIANAILAALQFLVVAVADGLSGQDLVYMLIVAAGAVGVFGLKNSGDMLDQLTTPRGAHAIG